MSDTDESLTGLDHAGRARQHRFGSLSSRGALFHLTVRTGSRSKGQSARASAAYIQRAGEYGRERERAGADDVLYSESGHMPGWAEADPLAYWDAADKHERANGRLFKRLEFALPTALSADEQRELAVGFARHLTDGEQLPYTLAIHAGGGTNPHCHLLISERGNDGLERSAEHWFKRYNAAAPELGGARKTEALKPRAWLDATREGLAAATNQALERAGHELRVDHRSYAERGIARVPGVHLGPTAHAMEARGIETERGNAARAVAQVNAQLAGLPAQQEEPAYERTRPEPERAPGRAGVEREGGDVGDRAGGLGASDRGERGPGLGNGGRAGREAEPERDRDLAGRDADPADAAHQADRAAAAGERGAAGADRAAGASVGAVVAAVDSGRAAGADSPPARGPDRGRGRDVALPDVRAAGRGSADLSRDVGGDDRGGEGADQPAAPGRGDRPVTDAAGQEREAEQQQAQERSQERAEQLIAAGQERAQAEKRSQERAEQLIAAGRERAQAEKRERERQQKLERAREREQQRARERDDFDLER